MVTRTDSVIRLKPMVDDALQQPPLPSPNSMVSSTQSQQTPVENLLVDGGVTDQSSSIQSQQPSPLVDDALQQSSLPSPNSMVSSTQSQPIPVENLLVDGGVTDQSYSIQSQQPSPLVDDALQQSSLPSPNSMVSSTQSQPIPVENLLVDGGVPDHSSSIQSQPTFTTLLSPPVPIVDQLPEPTLPSPNSMVSPTQSQQTPVENLLVDGGVTDQSSSIQSQPTFTTLLSPPAQLPEPIRVDDRESRRRLIERIVAAITLTEAETAIEERIWQQYPNRTETILTLTEAIEAMNQRQHPNRTETILENPSSGWLSDQPPNSITPEVESGDMVESGDIVEFGDIVESGDIVEEINLRYPKQLNPNPGAIFAPGPIYLQAVQLKHQPNPGAIFAPVSKQHSGAIFAPAPINPSFDLPSFDQLLPNPVTPCPADDYQEENFVQSPDNLDNNVKDKARKVMDKSKEIIELTSDVIGYADANRYNSDESHLALRIARMYLARNAWASIICNNDGNIDGLVEPGVIAHATTNDVSLLENAATHIEEIIQDYRNLVPLRRESDQARENRRDKLIAVWDKFLPLIKLANDAWRDLVVAVNAER
jgi:hypothetical protein